MAHTHTYSHILSDIHVDILSGTYSDIFYRILSDILLDEEEKATLITSRSPHLAGGEIHIIPYNIYVSIYIYIYIQYIYIYTVYIYTHIYWLVASTPLQKKKVSWDYYPQYNQYMESHKIHVPNHQPVHIYIYI